MNQHIIRHKLRNNHTPAIELTGANFEVNVEIKSDEEIYNAGMIHFINEENDCKINVTFNSIKFTNSCYIREIISNFNSVEFKDCIFQDLQIEGLCLKQNVKFHYCIFNNVNVNNLDINTLIFVNSFGKNILINAVLDEVKVHTFHIDYTFYKPNTENLYSTFLNQYSPTNKFEINIQIENKVNFDYLYIGNFYQTSLNDSNNNIFNIDLLVSTNFIDKNIKSFYIGNILNLRSLHISGSFPKLLIDNIKINTLVFKNFKFSKASFNHIKPIGIKSKFCLQESDFKDCTLWNVDLNSFNSVEFYYSRITDAEFNLVTVPNRIVSNYSKNKDGLTIKNMIMSKNIIDSYTYYILQGMI